MKARMLGGIDSSLQNEMACRRDKFGGIEISKARRLYDAEGERGAMGQNENLILPLCCH